MPNCVIEFPENLELQLGIGELTTLLHQVLVDSSLFSPDRVKVRAIGYKIFAIAEHAQPTPFLQITIAIMAGRSLEQKKALSLAVFAKAKEHNPDLSEIAVEIRDVEKETYTKNI